jgi:sulfide:quinone oxidoreductase
VLGVDPHQKEVLISGPDVSGKVDYDIVVLAMGRRLATETIPGFFEYSHHLLGVKAAREFGSAVSRFTSGSIVIGLCPGASLPVPVCEAAFAVANRFATAIEEGRVTVKVIFPESLREAFGGAEIHKELETAFARHHINVLYDVPIKEVTASEVLSADKHRIQYDLLMLLPPFKGQSMLNKLGITDDRDFVKVDGSLRIHDMPKAYAAGDIVAFSGPKLAHMAVRQGEAVAVNIARELGGSKPDETYYHEIASIIDTGGRDSIYLHYGIWDDELFSVRKGMTWSWVKGAHDAAWRYKHSKGAV